MANDSLHQKAGQYLHYLCEELATRRVGASDNRAATTYYAEKLAAFGFQTTTPEFDCLDWYEHGARLVVDGEAFNALVSPYSLGCEATAALLAAGSLAELEALDAAGQVLLLHGELAKEQLMPKNFVFYNPEEHQQIYRLLEAKAPQAIIAATGRNPELAGAVYPFPLIEDGDFDIPSVYLTDLDGERLLQKPGAPVSLMINAERLPARGSNVVGSKGAGSPRIVLTAHIDSKPGTPGALDNASGVVTLMLLAELLKDYHGELGVEIVALNGEDHYSAAGEMRYLADNQGRLDEILLNVNLDGLGYKNSDVAYSLYECPETLASAIRTSLGGRPGLIEGEPWYQSDHMMFVMNGRPALAITSVDLGNLLLEIAHSPLDTPELLDTGKLVDTALSLRDLILALNAQ